MPRISQARSKIVMVQFARHGVAAAMVLGDSLGEPFVAVVGRNVGPGESLARRRRLRADWSGWNLYSTKCSSEPGTLPQPHSSKVALDGSGSAKKRRKSVVFRVGFRSTLRVSKSKYSSGATVAPVFRR